MPKHGETKREQNAARLDRSRTRRAARAFAFFLVLVIAFAGGFFLRGNTALMNSLGYDLTAESKTNPGATISGSTYDSLAARVAEVQGILTNESVDTYDLDTATDTVIQALLDATGDSYLRYFNEERYENYLKESSTNYDGVGVLLAESEAKIYVADVFDNSVASSAGVVTGDELVSVDGNPVEGWTATEAVNALSGDAGTSVIVTWRHPSSAETENSTFTTTLTRGEYTGENVSSSIVEDTDGKIGYISLKQLTQNSADLVSQALEDLTAQGAQAFVFDLRDCSGGYLTEAVEVANLFMDSGTIVQIVTREGESTRTTTGTKVVNAPVVLLVNGNTAAAAEVVAAALQDSEAATLVGATTMGKGTVQVLKELSFGGVIRYTAAEYRTPSGYTIDGVGITPDVVVNASGDTDNQLTIAVSTAQGLLE